MPSDFLPLDLPPTASFRLVTDPMCSWCWGFQSVLSRTFSTSPHPPRFETATGKGTRLPLSLILGGLAPDCEEPMPEATQRFVQEAWRAVQSRTGAQFNWDFWKTCQPRRSTYPACRAVVAARAQNPEAEYPFYEAIQRAYYLEARNPSDLETLREIAGEIRPPLDLERFARDLESQETEWNFQRDLSWSQRRGIRGFPTLLLLLEDGSAHVLTAGYCDLATLGETLANWKSQPKVT